ncbi:hypothetical protein [Clostridium sp. DJ247]|uniref:hypothetical protein n=1 Tax=Clostridium sp. DJ247 TaxID=2726188 RepID=UPI0016278884|nr:hypothetical protein [Clostridium sp. DJ247]MBC2579679.1 hypothetical protein [Clostridium sp. DJ247]
MMNDLLKQIIVDVCYIGVTTIAGIATYYGKKFIDSKQNFIEKQKEVLKQQLGDAQYKKDVDTAKRIVMAVEQMAREHNWEGAVKHSKAVEKITAQTGLSSGDIFDIIKSVVGELNKDKEKTIVATTSNTTQTA